ncbi:MAG: glycosyltransferase, partial [Oscillospiraceae bacterium]|nr:glycosyltransferase [Oscillospiraceae bacterium]
AMAREVGKYTDKKFYVTPFGVKTELFSPERRSREENDGRFVIGTVKALKPKYGIDVLLKAVALVKQQHPEIPLELRIAGEGPCEAEYRRLTAELGIEEVTKWLGFISQEDAATEWANMDIAVVPSVTDSESFGVSAVEAEACRIPVIISDVPGLMEATQPGVTSIVVTRRSAEALADAIVLLYQNPEVRKRMGEAGRKLAVEKFDYQLCFENIEKIFLELAENSPYGSSRRH